MFFGVLVADPTNPTLSDLRFACDGRALVGGLSRELFSAEGAGQAMVAGLAAAREMMGQWPFIVGSTCTIPTETRTENIEAVIQALSTT